MRKKNLTVEIDSKPDPADPNTYTTTIECDGGKWVTLKLSDRGSGPSSIVVASADLLAAAKLIGALTEEAAGRPRAEALKGGTFDPGKPHDDRGGS